MSAAKIEAGPAPGCSFDRGVFTLSLDFELIWGTLDLFGPSKFMRASLIERNVVIDRLLALLAEFEIPATWCIVGHLFLDHCDGKHQNLARPHHKWFDKDWFVYDPGTDVTRDPIFYGSDLIQKILACPVPQEIGSHSFSHVIFGDEGCHRNVAVSEVRECVRVAKDVGLQLRSFVFPRNEVGHVDVLREYGFTCYRGPEQTWYSARNVPSPLRRIAHLLEVVLATAPPTVLPERDLYGLWNIPGSMIYFPMHGMRRYIPLSRRVSRAIKGLKAAAEDRRIFHLWFHPTNLSDGMEEMFSGLRSIFTAARELRDQGRLEFKPMGSFVPHQSREESLSGAIQC